MGIADYYYDLIKRGGDSTSLLTNFYKSLFGLEEVTQNFQIVLRRLVKIYGEDLIFFAILDCADIEVDHDRPYGLIVYFAKKRLAEKYNFTLSENLIKIAQKNIKEMEKKKRLKLDEDPLDYRHNPNE